MDMLDHQKTVLEQVSDNRERFTKELLKSLSWLNPSEIRNLYFWLMEKYGETQAEFIKTIFLKNSVVDLKAIH